MNGVQTRLKCKPNVKRCKRFVFAAHSPLLHPNTLKTKAIIHFQTDHILTRFVFPPLEAYFEVAKDTAHPFIVKTDLLETQVLGTSFNIRVYSPDNAHVTLLEGSIKVSDTHHTKELLIKPGQNATLQKGGTFSIHEVQAKEYSTWAEGQFYFDDTELIEIMRELGRWYNVNIIFTSKEAMHYRMHFQSDRGDSLPQVLNLLNSMQKVNAKFENDKVIVGL